METNKRVLIVGLAPEFVDFTHAPGLTAEKLMAGLNAEVGKLAAQGYAARLCLTDAGATADAVLATALDEQAWDCVVIGAGLRTLPEHFLLFERLVNVAHQHAPAARICFNTGPTNTAEAARRWV
jgi:hypothetical protein